MKNYLLSFFFFFFVTLNSVQNVEGQIELIQNGSFEIQSSCPTGGDQVWRAIGWYDCGNGGNPNTIATPDLLDTCSSGVLSSVPNNQSGFQYPEDGHAYCGMWTYTVTGLYREFIGSMLLQTLIPGHNYSVSFKTSRGSKDGHDLGTNHIGIKFSTIKFDSVINPAPINNISHVYSDTIITDTTNWIIISADWMADSAYQYVMVGNFFDDEHTDTTKFSSSSYFGFYYVDDVSVIDEIGNEIPSPSSSSTFSLSPNPFNTQLQIQYSITQPGELMVHDALGRKVKSCSLPSNQKTFQLSLAELSEGIYLVAINSGGQSYTEKVVKQ